MSAMGNMNSTLGIQSVTVVMSAMSMEGVVAIGDRDIVGSGAVSRGNRGCEGIMLLYP